MRFRRIRNLKLRCPLLWNQKRKVSSRLWATRPSIECRGQLDDRCGRKQIACCICSLTSPRIHIVKPVAQRRGKRKRKCAGSYQNTTTRWGQLVTGDHITSTKDNMLGIDGSKAMLVFKGDRNIERLYSDRSGEIERALRELQIVPEQSQPGVPQTSAMAERLVQDVLEGTRTALVRAGLPH